MALEAQLQTSLPALRDSQAFRLDVQLVATPGITVLLGPSGSGKTLTLNCLGGFVKPHAGRILLNGQILFDAASKVNLPPEKRRCGYIFQDHALFPHMTIRDNLLFAARAAPRDRSSSLERRRQISELLETFELTALSARFPAQLSGGQKQRAALARILVSAPHLLLLDEPTRGLDARLRESFYQLLEQTRLRLQIPVLLITHDVEECLRVADFICLTDHGRFLKTGTRQALVDSPPTVEVARALGIFNLLPAEVVAIDPEKRTSRLRVNGTDIPGPHLRGHLLGDRGTLCFRESEVELSSPDQPTLLSGRIVPVSHTSPCAQGVRIHFEDSFSATVPPARWEALRENQKLRVSLPPASLHFIE